MNRPIGLFGGTFDPIHQGHIQPVRVAAHQLGLDRVYLLPCHIPPHKAAPQVSSEQRRTMVKLVCENEPLFELDDRELRADEPSYTVNTLRQYRQEHPSSPLLFFMGMDSFNSFCRWYQWQTILELTHLVVCGRGGHPGTNAAASAELFNQQGTSDPQALHQQLAGLIYLADTPELNIASTRLRQHLKDGSADDNEIPRPVLDYIKQHGLYRL